MDEATRRRGIGDRIETVAALAALAFLAAGCALVLLPFLTALLWATLLVFTTWPAYAWLEARLRHRPALAAFVMTFLLALAFVVPAVLVATSLVDAVAIVADGLRRLLDRGPPPPPAWVAELPGFGPDLLEWWQELAADTARFAAFVHPYLLQARAWAFAAAVEVGRAALELSLSVFAAFFLYRGGIAAIDRVRTIGQRLVGDQVHRLLQVTAATVRGVVYGTIGGALAQGILAWIGFALAGVPGAAFLGSLTFLFGLVPGGPPLIWLGVSLWLFAREQTGAAVFTLLWGFFVVSGTKSLLKPYLISRESRLPVLIVFLGVAGGAAAFGFIGIFLGPILLGVAYALLLDWARPRAPAAASGTRPAFDAS